MFKRAPGTTGLYLRDDNAQIWADTYQPTWHGRKADGTEATFYTFEAAERWIGPERPPTVCTDCGAESGIGCPYDATTCSECSMIRERSVAGLSNDIPDCPAHGTYLQAEDDDMDDPEQQAATDRDIAERHAAYHAGDK